jgi:hypothetical protein
MGFADDFKSDRFLTCYGFDFPEFLMPETVEPLL